MSVFVLVPIVLYLHPPFQARSYPASFIGTFLCCQLFVMIVRRRLQPSITIFSLCVSLCCFGYQIEAASFRLAHFASFVSILFFLSTSHCTTSLVGLRFFPFHLSVQGLYTHEPVRCSTSLSSLTPLFLSFATGDFYLPIRLIS